MLKTMYVLKQILILIVYKHVEAVCVVCIEYNVLAYRKYAYHLLYIWHLDGLKQTATKGNRALLFFFSEKSRPHK